jgi:hypothetical protein
MLIGDSSQNKVERTFVVVGVVVVVVVKRVHCTNLLIFVENPARLPI